MRYTNTCEGEQGNQLSLFMLCIFVMAPKWENIPGACFSSFYHSLSQALNYSSVVAISF